MKPLPPHPRIIGDNSIYLIILKVMNALDTGVTMNYHHVIPNRCILSSLVHATEEHSELRNRLKMATILRPRSLHLVLSGPKTMHASNGIIWCFYWRSWAFLWSSSNWKLNSDLWTPQICDLTLGPNALSLFLLLLFAMPSSSRNPSPFQIPSQPSGATGREKLCLWQVPLWGKIWDVSGVRLGKWRS